MQKDFIYENYLKMPDDLEFEQAMKVYEELLEENLEEDEIYDKLWDHALHCMIDYGSLRAHWKRAWQRSKMERRTWISKKKNRRFCMLCFFDLWSICKVKYDENVKSKFCQIKRSVRRTL